MLYALVRMWGWAACARGWVVQLLVVAVLMPRSEIALAGVGAGGKGKRLKKRIALVSPRTPIDCTPPRKYKKRGDAARGRGGIKKVLKMKVSRDGGQKLIKWYERLRLTAYPDFGVWSIGWGSRANANYPYTISSLKAEELFRKDIERVEKCLNQMIIRADVKQHEFDAIASWTYNVGEGAAMTSTLIRKYNMGEPEREVAAEFLRWIHVTDPKSGKKVRKPGLLARREAERKLFLTGKVEFF